MGFKPYPELTVERIDNDGHYCADNCKWATMAEQVLNQSRNGLPKGQPLGFHNSDNPNRYIHKQASGTYAVIMHMVRCGPKTRIGTYPTLEEAQAVRDICEYERNVYVNLGLVHNNNWTLTTDGRVTPAVRFSVLNLITTLATTYDFRIIANSAISGLSLVLPQNEDALTYLTGEADMTILKDGSAPIFTDNVGDFINDAEWAHMSSSYEWGNASYILCLSNMDYEILDPEDYPGTPEYDEERSMRYQRHLEWVESLNTDDLDSDIRFCRRPSHRWLTSSVTKHLTVP